jgi:hypothetical protein
MKPKETVQAGVPDPELKTSLIVDDGDGDVLTLDAELENPACYFNNVAYPIGQYIRSGSELLHCEERGIWVRKEIDI